VKNEDNKVGSKLRRAQKKGSVPKKIGNAWLLKNYEFWWGG